MVEKTGTKEAEEKSERGEDRRGCGGGTFLFEEGERQTAQGDEPFAAAQPHDCHRILARWKYGQVHQYFHLESSVPYLTCTLHLLHGCVNKPK